MNRTTSAAAFALVALISGCGSTESAGHGGSNSGNQAASGGVATGASASDFTARDIEGHTIKLSNYLGKQVVLLSFCATWCEPCVMEFPHLRKMYDQNRAKGFIILAIAMDGPETVASVPAFARRNQVNFPMLTDEDSRIASIYNPKKSAPLTVLIDKQARIVSIREGYNPGDEEFLSKDIEKVLDASTATQ